MVRSRELEHRARLLRIIQSGEQPCRRLFLDYHGLRLVWSYMTDAAMSDGDKARDFRLEILKTLATLPIPNKTMLMDSKVFSLVEAWASTEPGPVDTDSPEDEQQRKVEVCFSLGIADIVKKNSSAFIKPLYVLFNRCIIEGKVPDVWKISNVTPILKSGDKTDDTNYRPISFSCLAKIFESVLVDYLKIHLEPLIIPHGFINNQ